MISTHLIFFQFFPGASALVASLSVSCELRSRTGALLPNLTAISWAWFDATDPNSFAAPTDQGQVETTDGDGLLEIDLPNTALSAGQEGTLVLRSDDGVSIGAYNLAVSA